jgi:hypothetical protein
MIYYASINSGELKFPTDKINTYINSLYKRFGNCQVTIEIKKYYSNRSNDQNALYFLWLKLISEHTGYTTEELHASFKSMFLTDRGGQLPIVRSTTALNTSQFAQYLENVRIKAAEMEIILPDPIDYYNQKQTV